VQFAPRFGAPRFDQCESFKREFGGRSAASQPRARGRRLMGSLHFYTMCKLTMKPLCQDGSSLLPPFIRGAAAWAGWRYNHSCGRPAAGQGASAPALLGRLRFVGVRWGIAYVMIRDTGPFSVRSPLGAVARRSVPRPDVCSFRLWSALF